LGWDGAGAYTRQHNFSADASVGIKILAARMDQELDDIASAIPVALARNGQNVPTANLPMGGFRHINVGAPTSVNNYMRSREFIENIPVFMDDTASSADRISVSAQYFTSVSANQAPGDGTHILVRALSNKSSAAIYLNGHSANVHYTDGGRIASAVTAGGIYKLVYSSADAFWKLENPDPIDGHFKYVRTPAEIAAGVTPTNYQYEPGDVRRYGADSSGVSDSATALNAAISQAQQTGGRLVRIPAGIFLIGSKISVPASVMVIGEGPQTVIKKGFNGDMFEVASFAGLQDMNLDGESGSFTGRGVIITAGTNPSGGRQYFRNIRISDTASFNVEYTADGVGFGSVWDCCDFSVPGNDIYCIKLPTDTGTGNRHFVGCRAVGDSLIDINNAANTNLNGCMSGRSTAGSLWCIGWGANSAQSVINGCRLAGGGQTGTVRGTLHNMVGCDIAATGLTFDTGTTSCKFRSNTTGAITWTDNSGSTGTSVNEFDVNVTSYAPTVTAAGGGFSIGDGSINGSYTRDGRLVVLSFRLIAGSTTNFGTGELRFSLPFTAHNRNYMGSVRALDSGTNFIAGVVQIEEGNATYCTLYFDGAAAAASATIPITWASGDEIWATVTYDA